MAILNGCIVDGGGGMPYISDVGVDKGKIVRIGKGQRIPARKELDASGKYVTPGFIDVHRHEDAAVFASGFGELQIRQGITAGINGNCGLSVAPFPRNRRAEIARYLKPIIGNLPREAEFDTFSEYLALVETRSLALNFGMLIGNGALRRAVKGFASGGLSPEEIRKAQGYLEDALESGAFGASLGLAYIPENLFDARECIELLAPLRGGGVLLTAHIRGEGDSLTASVEEAAGIAEGLSAPLHISHFKCIGQKNWGWLLEKALETLDCAKERIPRITFDVYPWTAGSTQLAQILPPALLEGGLEKTAERLKDPRVRKECKDILKTGQTRFDNLVELAGWENIMVSSVQTEKNQRHIGKRISEIAAEQGADPFDAAFDLLAEEHGNVAMVDFIVCEQDIETIVRRPESLIVSDSTYPAGGRPHPRQYGTYTKFLSEYVRDRKILPLETAIRKITGGPAEVFSIPHKGFVKEGYDADLAVFDLAEIQNHATYLDPCQFGTGFAAVIVNGEIASLCDQFLGCAAGKVLRRTRF
ncbi:MAG: amidohydrolase family protein [Spirochaetaceae bacterium]|nr:amidohydrolase family protein [Spirochaetaceae bacterium]